jgi:hypothetical protein
MDCLPEILFTGCLGDGCWNSDAGIMLRCHSQAAASTSDLCARGHNRGFVTAKYEHGLLSFAVLGQLWLF